MSVADELRSAIEGIPAVDHHAHLLAGPGSSIGLADVLTESADPAQIPHVRDHPSFVAGVQELAALLDVDPDETAIARVREVEGFEGFTRRLLGVCGFEEGLVDDGFQFPGALTLEQHAALMPCPTRRILRIEATAEEAAFAWPGWPSVRERFRATVTDATNGGAAALKTIAAYRYGLDLPPPDPADAETAYERWRVAETTRLVEPELVSFFLSEALDVARPRSIPLQVHTGFGNTDLTLHRADPTLLRPLLEDGRNRDVPIVLLHCYPFVRQASYLASVYGNVHLDLSLAMTLAPHRGADLILEALDLAPASKLLFGTDASRLPELFFLGARSWRRSLASALGTLVERRILDQERALRWAELILRGNARRVYG